MLDFQNCEAFILNKPLVYKAKKQKINVWLLQQTIKGAERTIVYELVLPIPLTNVDNITIIFKN